MRMLLSVALCVILTFSLVACGTTKESTENKPHNLIENGSVTTNNNSSTESSSATEKENSAELAEISFDCMTVVDDENVAIKIKSIDEKSLFGYKLNIELENKSTDTNYMFALDYAAVNGIETDPLFAKEVAAGKKANEDITFMDNDLDILDKYTDIELAFRVHDADDWSASNIVETTVHVYPYGEENAAVFTYEPKELDNVLIDNDEVSVVVTGYEEDSIWGYGVGLVLVNKTDKTLMFSVDDVSVNGYMVDPFFATEVHAGKTAFSSMTFLNSSLEENSITAVDSIEFLLKAYDVNDWSAGHLIDSTFTLNP